MVLLTNNLKEKIITLSQEKRSFHSTHALFVIYIVLQIHGKIHSFSANQRRVFFRIFFIFIMVMTTVMMI